MTQSFIAKNTYRMKILFPYFSLLLLSLFVASVVCFLVFTGKSANAMHNAKDQHHEDKISNGADSFYRDLSFQASVISLLTLTAFSNIYLTFKKLI